MHGARPRITVPIKCGPREERRENSRARALRQRLLRNGIETLVNVATVNGERLIRIRVGPFTKAAELQTYIDKIKALGLDARVLTY